MRNPCECVDKNCSSHRGKTCASYSAKTILHRVDMDDVSGTMFCPPCADDAMESGLFRTEDYNLYQVENDI